MSLNMDYSRESCEHLTEQFEGCKLTAYQDIRGIWTIGYGHTGHDVRPGLTITQDEAEQLLLHDIESAVNTVNHLVTVQITQHEFDALVDFTFNVGSGNFASSTLLRYLNAGLLDAAAKEFERWDKAAGVVVAGLLRRRIAEENWFKTSDGA